MIKTFSPSNNKKTTLLRYTYPPPPAHIKKWQILVKTLPSRNYCLGGRNVYNALAVYNCRYPSTPEEFYASRLPGTWDQDRAGKRMKLPTPETWETQVSLKGNKASTWEGLIGTKPYYYSAHLHNY